MKFLFFVYINPCIGKLIHTAYKVTGFTEITPFCNLNPERAYSLGEKLKMFSVKELVESSTMSSVPSNYVFHENTEDSMLYHETENIPAIDFSQLTSSNPNERSKAIQQLGDACRDWGFFMVYIFNLNMF